MFIQHQNPTSNTVEFQIVELLFPGSELDATSSVCLQAPVKTIIVCSCQSPCLYCLGPLFPLFIVVLCQSMLYFGFTCMAQPELQALFSLLFFKPF
jgi:hypothetical protein